MNDKLKPIHLHIKYILSSKSDPSIVPPILDPANSTFDYNVKEKVLFGGYLSNLNFSDSASKRLWVR